MYSDSVYRDKYILELINMLNYVQEDKIEGENLEYDALYTELESLASAVPDSVMGDEVIAGREPDWRAVNNNCLELWKRTRDLRVAAYYTLSMSQLEGLSGYYNGIQLIDYLVSNMWDNFYPHLDPDDDNDPTERLNILQIISPSISDSNQSFTFLRVFRKIKLFNNKNYTLRDLLIYQGDITTEDGFDSAVFKAEALSVPKEEIEEKIDIINKILQLLDDIDSSIASKIESGYSNCFECVKKELSTLLKFYSKHVLSEEGAVGDDSQSEEMHNPSSEEVAAKISSSFNLESYKPKNRSEALLLVKKSADYFREVEPTNPVPYLLERVLRIAEMNFIDILRDIDPGAVDRIKEQLGIPRD